MIKDPAQQQTADTWNVEWADIILKYYWHTHAHYRVVEEYLKGTVLDIGCGPGFLAARCFPNIGVYTGIDHSAKAIEYARMLFPGAHFLQHDLRVLPLPFRNGEFQTVVLSEVLEHLDDFHPLLAEAQRIAGTYIVISTPVNMHGVGHVWPEWTYEDLVRELSPLGKIIEIRIRPEENFNLVWIRKA